MRRLILWMVYAALMGSGLAWAASDNPFGFETQTHPRKYDYCEHDSELFHGHGFTCTSAPRPHPKLPHYVVQFVDGVGLCTIEAVVDSLPWPEVTDLEKMFARQIANKYGPHRPEPDIRLRQKKTKRGGTGYLNVYRWVKPAGTPGWGEVAQIDLLVFETDPTGNQAKSWVAVHVKLGTAEACETRIQEDAERAF